MGGGPVGLRLSEAGFSVLFLEKGGSPQEAQALKGQFAEMFEHSTQSRNETFKKAGRWTDDIYDCSNHKPKKIEAFIGSGVGGSSALYGAVLERFRPSDFIKWPLSYSDFENYYGKAEILFQVKKRDRASHPGNQSLFAHLESRGLHPYQLPFATSDREACGNCQSFLCNKSCKNDSGKICIQRAIEKYGAEIKLRCDVQKIEISNQVVTGVSGMCGEHAFFYRARHVILAAGALQSPVLLQKSGIGNQSGQLGRNLMRHFVDLYALKIDSNPENPRAKEIGFNDFYEREDMGLGSVQSFGRLPPTKVILDEMQRNFSFQDNQVFRFLFQLLRPVLSFEIRFMTANRLVMASIMEDSPQPENRVWWENGRICISYHVSSEGRKKITLMRKKLKAIFKTFPLLFIPGAEKNKMLAHVCGTCRMGVSPHNSVVDSSNKVHGTDNLYVVDSSFFPSSGGTNPALTIAANSLRVADILIHQENVKQRNEVADNQKKGILNGHKSV